MHELSIVVHVIETIMEHIADDSGRVRSVQLRVGSLSGVVPDALRFAWEVACRGTRLEGSALEIEELQARVWCDRCQCEQAFSAPMYFRCPVCDAAASRLTAGRELEILSVEMAEHEQAQAD